MANNCDNCGQFKVISRSRKEREKLTIDNDTVFATNNKKDGSFYIVNQNGHRRSTNVIGGHFHES